MNKKKAENEKLKKVLQEKGLSIANLAGLMGTSIVTANKMVYKKGYSPRIRTALRATKVLKINLEDLGFNK